MHVFVLVPRLDVLFLMPATDDGHKSPSVEKVDPGQAEGIQRLQNLIKGSQWLNKNQGKKEETITHIVPTIFFVRHALVSKLVIAKR